MTKRQFYDWQTAGGADLLMRLVDALERAEVSWCFFGDLAVGHWAKEPMVTRDVDFVVATTDIEKSIAALAAVGFTVETHEWSVNFTGKSSVSLQLSTEAFYRESPARAVAADVHGILMRVAALEDTLAGKLEAYADPQRRQSKRLKDLADIARLVDAHPHLWPAVSQPALSLSKGRTAAPATRPPTPSRKARITVTGFCKSGVPPLPHLNSRGSAHRLRVVR